MHAAETPPPVKGRRIEPNFQREEHANCRRHTIERAAGQRQRNGASRRRPIPAPNTAKTTVTAMRARIASLRLVTAFRCCHWPHRAAEAMFSDETAWWSLLLKNLNLTR